MGVNASTSLAGLWRFTALQSTVDLLFNGWLIGKATARSRSRPARLSRANLPRNLLRLSPSATGSRAALFEVIHAYPHSRHLRHLYGFAGGAGQGTRSSQIGRPS